MCGYFYPYVFNTYFQTDAPYKGLVFIAIGIGALENTPSQ